MANFTAFLSYVFIANFAPGPNTIMSMSNASRYGFKKSIMFNVGIFFGVFIVFALSSIFTVALYDFMPSIKLIMSYVSAAYILWLAWQTYKSKPQNDGKIQKNTSTFSSGLLLQFFNLGVIIYGLTTVSTFIIPHYKSVSILAYSSVILAFLGFIGTCCWALFGSIFQKFFIKNYKFVNIVMTILLVYCSVSLFFNK
ncbi:export protein, LysE family [Gottschalkia acidurici 9a]|uniref:Export protein, LysE family n=1 Tax=Gottschalkia acidurici (strain ATCC 7906 / DSM 604 / BCRC 14475 / CIP 104303 / KCTC 5404 / NCIMB 10678 / 9a) TaxID=1128398 RepID=K0B1W7_GOTA9|nr:LysE family transporter [Gottschalkia acidurici]AFS78905.1 export protein, LysE family [Gottschalkia acidurici 9a]